MLGSGDSGLKNGMRDASCRSNRWLRHAGRGLLGLALLLVAIAPAFGQLVSDSDEEDPLLSDRPGFTESSATVGKGRFLVEGGYNFSYDQNSANTVTEHLFPETLLRVGIHEAIELRVLWEGYVLSESLGGSDDDEFEGGAGEGIDLEEGANGGTDMNIGCKIGLLSQQGCRPRVALLQEVFFPIGTRGLSAGIVQTRTSLLYGWELGEWAVGGSSGIGNRRAKRDAFIEINQSITGARKLGERLAVYTEWFSFYHRGQRDGGPTHFLNSGFAYLVSDDFQLDWFIGMGLNRKSSDLFTGFGYALRF